MQPHQQPYQQPIVPSATTHNVQSNLSPLFSNIPPINCSQSSVHTPLQGQAASDQNLQISRMSFKVPLPQFCPLTNDPWDWLDNFEYYCNQASTAYNLPLEKLMWDNLYTLFPKSEKSWLMSKSFSGRPFSLTLLKEQLLDYFSRLCNTNFKDIYMREWDGVQSYVDFGKGKLESLKIIFPNFLLKKLIDIVRSRLPDDVNIKIGKGHMMYETEDYFFDVLTHQDVERERANFELQNELANQANPLNSTQNGEKHSPLQQQLSNIPTTIYTGLQIVSTPATTISLISTTVTTISLTV